MKHLLDFILESNMLNIFEGAVGVKLSSKNVNLIVDYLDDKQKGKKCIIPDSNDVRKQYSEFEKWFCDFDDINDALFFLKTNGMLCMYEPHVKDMSNEELENFSIRREGENYYLPNIKAKLEATSKKINSAKSDLKIWPDIWDKYIVRGEHQLEENAKMPTTVIDFKNQGAYVIKDVSEIKKDLCKSFENIFGKDSILTQIFASDNIKTYLSNLKDEDRKEVSNNMANVLSEPLAIISLIENIDDVQTKIKEQFDKDLGDLYEIIIPIRQNWPVADYYAHFKNMPDRLIAISVKSNGAGNSSTIMGCLPIVDIDKISINDKDKNVLSDFFNEIIPQFETDNKIELKLSKEIKENVQNISLYTLYLLKEESKDTKNSNAKKLINSFDKLIDLLKNQKDLYSQLHKICELGGTNVIEKIFVCLFNANTKSIELIKNAVGDATSCYKITVNNNGNVKCIKQSPEGNAFRLIIKGGGQGLNLIVKNGKLNDIKLGHKTSQGQWLGYTFH